jgi:hypothetical protein
MLAARGRDAIVSAREGSLPNPGGSGHTTYELVMVQRDGNLNLLSRVIASECTAWMFYENVRRRDTLERRHDQQEPQYSTRSKQGKFVKGNTYCFVGDFG